MKTSEKSIQISELQIWIMLNTTPELQIGVDLDIDKVFEVTF